MSATDDRDATAVGRRADDGTAPWNYEPGDYGRFEGDWWCRPPGTPNNGIGRLTNHDVTEHDDAAITVAPSILLSSRWAGEPWQWHGYLEAGRWRTC